VASLFVFKVLKWDNDLVKLRPVFRNIFKTYAAYILTINLCFGALSLFRPQWLLDPIPLAKAVAGFITAYWGVRLFLEFAYYDRSARPPGTFWMLAEWALIGLFAYFTGVYGYIAIIGG
jgi:hypothetical protein